jgi:ribulose-5-phosphate 4-epimerase/fuculose-1-phosphate aldolase
MPDITTARRELAAAFRLAAHFDYNEGICNHFSVALQSDPKTGAERYLINPYGLHWSEMKPDNLLLIDGEGTVIEGHGEVEATALHIHVAGHRANPRHACILHVHMPWATSITMIEGGRLEMAHQTAARFHDRTTYLEFGGIALDASEGERIAEVQRRNMHADVIFLEHHGVSVGGPSVAVAFDDLYYLERACRQQVLAQSTGGRLKLLPKAALEETARQWRQVLVPQADQHFAALMRVHQL